MLSRLRHNYHKCYAGCSPRSLRPSELSSRRSLPAPRLLREFQDATATQDDAPRPPEEPCKSREQIRREHLDLTIYDVSFLPKGKHLRRDAPQLLQAPTRHDVIDMISHAGAASRSLRATKVSSSSASCGPCGGATLAVDQDPVAQRGGVFS